MNYENSQNINQMKSFDPYEILEISRDADKNAIRKAFKILSIKFHPDKNPGDPDATSKFILIGKAKECLLDKEKKELCEKYGNPDGNTSFHVSIALPSFLLKKENHVAVLCIFFFIFVLFLPGLILFWY